ncbi:MAG: hypothetical protein ACK5LK_10730, partial [Chthoniobacterales bacterium]
LTILTGSLLILLGLGGYFGTDAQSVTALIPAFFGIVFALLGLIATAKDSLRKHVMHVAALLSLLGFGSVFFRIFKKLPALFTGQPVEPSNVAVWLQVLFVAICLSFLVACIRSFVKARLARAS